jgi:hypothetical protein
MLSIIRPGATAVVAPCSVGPLTTDEKADESNVQVEFNCFPGRREQPNQWLRSPNIRSYPEFQQTRSSKEAMEEEQYRQTHHLTSEALSRD